MMRNCILLALVFLRTCALSAGESRVAIITGTSRGVGLETAKCLAKEGFIVYGTVRPTSKFPSEIKNVHFLSVDLTSEPSIRAAMQTVLENEHRIDVLINNAGYAVVGPIETLTEQEMHQQMEVNFFAPIRCTQAVLPTMRQQESGHIINMSSVNAFQTPPYGGMYAASKAALEAFSESLCIEVRPYNIAVSIVEPGLLKTNFSIVLGTKEVPSDPYQKIVAAISADLKTRMEHPEFLSGQSPQEIANFLLHVLQDPYPKLRYQTSESARLEVSGKLLDLSGDLYLEGINQSLGAD